MKKCYNNIKLQIDKLEFIDNCQSDLSIFLRRNNMQSLYPAFGHPEGIQAAPWYQLRDGYLYPAFGHPEGIQAAPWYRIG